MQQRPPPALIKFWAITKDNSVFLKKPQRIAALAMVMGVSYQIRFYRDRVPVGVHGNGPIRYRPLSQVNSAMEIDGRMAIRPYKSGVEISDLVSLMVYSLAQHQIRHALERTGASVPDQRRKDTQTPTMGWIFQCLQNIQVVWIDGKKDIANLTPQRRHILRFFGVPC